MKILYCILHTRNQSDRYDNIMQTWGKDIIPDLLFYSDHENINEFTVKVSDRSDYISGEEKQVNIIGYLNSNMQYNNYSWYFFCDNDTFVNTKNLNKLILSCDTNKVHGLVANSWPSDPSLKYCGGGAGFLMSKNILQKITNQICIQNTGYSDVTMGLCLRNMIIDLQHHSFFHSFPPTHYNYNINDLKEQITFHYIKDLKSMSELYENSKSYT